MKLYVKNIMYLAAAITLLIALLLGGCAMPPKEAHAIQRGMFSIAECEQAGGVFEMVNRSTMLILSCVFYDDGEVVNWWSYSHSSAPSTPPPSENATASVEECLKVANTTLEQRACLNQTIKIELIDVPEENESVMHAYTAPSPYYWHGDYCLMNETYESLWVNTTGQKCRDWDGIKLCEPRYPEVQIVEVPRLVSPDLCPPRGTKLGCGDKIYNETNKTFFIDDVRDCLSENLTIEIYDATNIQIRGCGSAGDVWNQVECGDAICYECVEDD